MLTTINTLFLLLTIGQKYQITLYTRVCLGEESSLDVLIQGVTGTAVCLLWKLSLEIVETFESFSDILQLKQTPCQPEMSLQMTGVQSQSLQTVPEGVIMVSIPVSHR